LVENSGFVASCRPKAVFGAATANWRFVRKGDRGAGMPSALSATAMARADCPESYAVKIRVTTAASAAQMISSPVLKVPSRSACGRP